MSDRLIELIRLAKVVECSIPDYDEIGRNMAFAHFLINNGVTVQEWISVEDRLPEKDGYYLAFVKGYFAKCTRLLGFAKDGRKVDEFDFDEGSKNVWYRYDSEYGYVTVEDVTHWMPLPPAPEDVK